MISRRTKRKIYRAMTIFNFVVAVVHVGYLIYVHMGLI